MGPIAAELEPLAALLMVCLHSSHDKKRLKRSTEVGAKVEAEGETAKLHVAAALCAVPPLFLQLKTLG